MVEAEVSPGSFKPFEVTAVHLIYVGLGFFIAIFGMFSLFIKERLYLGEAPLAAVFGIIVGPAAINLFDPSDWANNETRPPGGEITNEVTLEVMRVTIALSVFAIGVELPKKYLLKHWRSLIMLLGPVMIWGWMVTAGLIYALIPGLDFLNSMVVAACVTPTDPILAQAVVGGPWAEKHVPAHLRHMLMCESGCNDGAAFPFLYLALFLTTNRDNRGKAMAEWFYDALAYQIIFGTILGALVGWAARKAMRFSERKKLVDRESFVAQYISLAIASMGVNVLLGSDDLLAAFACGTAFAWDGWFTRQTEDSNFSNIVDLLFNCASFIYIGALMPFHEFTDAGGSLNLWRLFVLAILVLMLKRIPIMVALWKWIPDIKTFREAVFSGHFGPMGVGAIFIATLGRTQLPEEVANPPETSNDVLALTIQPIVFFFVLCSIVVHGLTIPFFAFSRKAHTVTRTWSKHASFSNADGPDWMNRVRRFRSQDVEEPKEGEGEMSEIRRVLDSQLGVIGKGAIGGDAEKELRGEETISASPSGGSAGSSSAAAEQDATGSYNSPNVGLINIRTERDLEKAANEIEDPEDYHDEEYDADPASEWAGEDTCEVRRYKAALLKKREEEETQRRAKSQMKEESERRSRDTEEGLDISEAPMDRELLSGDVREEEEDAYVRRENQEDADEEQRAGTGRTSKQDKEALAISRCGGGDDSLGYPRTRSWVEGHKLVIEHLQSRSSDPKVEIIDLDQLTEEDRESISSAESPALAWVHANKEHLKHFVEGDEHEHWGVRDAASHLIRLGIPSRWENAKRNGNLRAKGSGKSRVSQEEESSTDRNNRFDLLFGGMEASKNGRSEETPSHSQNVEQDSRPSFHNPNPFSASPSASSHGNFSSSNSISSGERSRSPPAGSGSRRKSAAGSKPPKVHVRPSAAGSLVSGRRNSMRKRVLAGQMSLSGRKTESNQSEDEDVEEVDAEGNPTQKASSRPKDKSHHRASSVSFLGVDPSHDAPAPTPSRPNSRSGSPSRISTRGRRSGSSHLKPPGRESTATDPSETEAGPALVRTESRDSTTGEAKPRGRGGRITSLLSSLTTSNHQKDHSNSKSNEAAQSSPIPTPQRQTFSNSNASSNGQTPSSIPQVHVSGASDSIFRAPGAEQDGGGRVTIDLPNTEGPPILAGRKKGDDDR